MEVASAPVCKWAVTVATVDAKPKAVAVPGSEGNDTMVV